jgi:hypothetical protein
MLHSAQSQPISGARTFPELEPGQDRRSLDLAGAFLYRLFKAANGALLNGF